MSILMRILVVPEVLDSTIPFEYVMIRLILLLLLYCFQKQLQLYKYTNKNN